MVVVLSRPEVWVRAVETAQRPLPLSTEGVQRVVWDSRFGPILIEVVDGVCFVNRQPVEPAHSLPEE